MIHISQLRKILTEKKPFSCRVWTASGEIMSCKEVVCTSTYHKGKTANLLFIESREVRKVRVICIFEVNDNEIYI